MILTLTANPSIDRTVALGAPLRRGAVQRTESELSQAGGKGVNITRACVAAGAATLAVLPASAGDPLVADLVSAGLPHRLVPVEGAARVNLALTEPDGTTTKLNSAGVPLDAAAMAAVRSTLVELAPQADWVVLAGSLPPGAPTDWYADLLTDLLPHTRVAVDTSDGPLLALVATLAQGHAPHLMKPNGEELASFLCESESAHAGPAPTGAELEADPEAAAAAAGTLLAAGVETVLATLGGHGAVLVTAEGAWHAAPPPTTVVSTVGAGDSSLTGYLLAHLRDLPPAQRLALAVAYGSAAAGLPGTTVPQPADLRPDLVVVRRLPPPVPTSGQHEESEG